MKSRPKVSLIIPTFQRQTVLCDTLKMAVDQDYPNYEIIVVDQTPAVSMELQRVLLQLNGRVNYLRLTQANLPSARNAGVREATGEIIVFIDDDVVIDSTYLSDHAGHYSDERIGGVSGLTVSPNDVDGTIALSNYGKFLAGRAVRAGDVVSAFALIGGNSSYRRQAFIDAGWSDERFYGSASAEDVDLSWRVKARGYELLFDTNIRMVHLALEAGGCENRNRDPLRAQEVARQQKELWLYCVLKNGRSLTRTGRVAVWQEMWRYYRDAAFNRDAIVRGLSHVVRQHSAYAYTVRRARQLARAARAEAVQ